MKRKLLLLILSLICISCFAEGELTISELEMICCDLKWSDAVSYVTRKSGWIFYESKKLKDTNQDKVITLAYNVDIDDHNRAEGFLNIYIDGDNDGEITQISYIHYSNSNEVDKSLIKKGYKKTDAQLEDDNYCVEYSSKRLYFYVKSEKYDDGYWVKERVTYNLIKKGSKDDALNGHKVIYDDEGNIETEYTIKDGKKVGIYTWNNGQGESYKYDFVNGNVVEVKKYDKENRLETNLKRIKGDVFEYRDFTFDDNGEVVDKIEGKTKCDIYDWGISVFYLLNCYSYCDYTITKYQNGKVDNLIHCTFNDDVGQVYTTNSNGNIISSVNRYKDTLNGECKWFLYDANGNLKKERIKNYKMGDLNGTFIENEYIGDSVKIEYVAHYSDNTGNGPVSLAVIKNGVRTIVGEMTLKFGDPVGKYMWNTHDTLEIGYYDSNGKANGDFYSYRCLKMCDGTNDIPLSIDEDDFVLIAKGKYINGDKHGKWININTNGSIETKEYKRGVLHGKMSFVDGNGLVLNYGSFVNGKRDGLWHQYSWEEDLDGCVLDTCLYDKGKWIKSVLSKDDSIFRYYVSVDDNKTHIVYDLIVGNILRERKTYISDSNLRLLDEAYFGFPIGLENDSLNGKYEVYDEKGRTTSKGFYIDGEKTGDWYYYYWNDDVYVYCNDYGFWVIKTISSDKPYSGRFNLVSDNDILYIFKVKKGLLHGKTVLKDIKTNKTVGYRQYKKGILVNE